MLLSPIFPPASTLPAELNLFLFLAMPLFVPTIFGAVRGHLNFDSDAVRGGLIGLAWGMLSISISAFGLCTQFFVNADIGVHGPDVGSVYYPEPQSWIVGFAISMIGCAISAFCAWKVVAKP